VPAFEPFRGIRYDTRTLDPALVTSPPYDVISHVDRESLVAGSEFNVTLIDLPATDPNQPTLDPYRVAAERLISWRRDGILLTDASSSFTVHRMSSVDEDGVAHHTIGVIGALRLSAPGEGEILCHEYTTPKAKSDRLDLLGATDANLSAVWGLSPAPGLTALLTLDEPPTMEFSNEGVTNTVWIVSDEERIEEISSAIAAHPVVIADGHHRYETSLAHRDRVRSTSGNDTPAESVMCFVVELSEAQFSVGPIHRLVTGLDDAVDLISVLEEFFEIEPFAAPSAGVVGTLEAVGALALVLPDRDLLLHPRPGMFAATRDLDSSRLDLALASIHGIDVTYQHGVENIREAVASGGADFGVLLRPVTVAQIIDIAEGGERMPPKSTFFYPKPPTGIVLRSLLQD